jgi:hypothetical protein
MSRKIIIPIVFITLLVFLNIIIAKKLNIKNENLIVLNTNDFLRNNSYDFINEKIKALQEEQMCVKDECNKVCNYVQLPQNFKFNTKENIVLYIEEFFILYLNLLDIGCINAKINKYIGKTLTLGKIFREKNLTLDDFSPLTYLLIDNLYFANNALLNKSKLNNYGIFKLLKNKFNQKLMDYKYYYKYDSDFYITLTKNNILSKNIQSEHILSEYIPGEHILSEYIPGEHILSEYIPGKHILSEYIPGEQINSETELILNNILDCKEDLCKIDMSSLYYYDMVKRLTPYENINFEKLKDDLGLNINILIEICQLSIIIDLFLKYNNIKSLIDLKDIITINNLALYNSLKEELFKNINNIKTNHYNISDFKKYTSLNIEV